MERELVLIGGISDFFDYIREVDEEKEMIQMHESSKADFLSQLSKRSQWLHKCAANEFYAIAYYKAYKDNETQDFISCVADLAVWRLFGKSSEKYRFLQAELELMLTIRCGGFGWPLTDYHTLDREDILTALRSSMTDYVIDDAAHFEEWLLLEGLGEKEAF